MPLLGIGICKNEHPKLYSQLFDVLHFPSCLFFFFFFILLQIVEHVSFSYSVNPGDCGHNTDELPVACLAPQVASSEIHGVMSGCFFPSADSEISPAREENNQNQYMEPSVFKIKIKIVAIY